MFVEFPIPIMPSFIKFDFSEIPALITTFAFGPSWGVLCCLLKNILHLPFGSSMGIGEMSNFILGAALTFTAGIIYKHRHNRKWAAIASLTGSVVMALVSVVTNYFIIYPLYVKVLGLSNEIIVSMYDAIMPVGNLFLALIVFNVPFTAAKGIIDSIICFLIYKPLSPLLKGRKKAEEASPEENTDIRI